MPNHRPRRRGIRQKHVAIGLSEAPYPCLKLSVRGAKAFVDSHGVRMKFVVLLTKTRTKAFKYKASRDTPDLTPDEFAIASLSCFQP